MLSGTFRAPSFFQLSLVPSALKRPQYAASLLFAEKLGAGGCMCLLLKNQNRFSTFLATSYLKSTEKSRNKWGQTFSGLVLQHRLKYMDCNSRRVLFCFVLFLDLVRIYPPIIATNLTKQMKNLTGENVINHAFRTLPDAVFFEN